MSAESGFDRAQRTSRLDQARDLCRALDEWKNAGADSLTVVDAIIRLADQRCACAARQMGNAADKIEEMFPKPSTNDGSANER